MTTTLPCAVATVLLVAAGARAGDPPPAPPTDALEVALEQLDALDRTTIALRVEGEPLARVVDELSARSPVPIRADWTALDRLAVSPRDRVSVELPPTASLAMALAAICLQVGDDFERPVVEMYAGQAVLTTRAATAAMRLTDVYDVRDLLADDDVLETVRAEPSAPTPPPPATAPAPEDGNDDEDAPGLPPGFEVPDLGELEAAPPPRTPGERLLTMIAEHVDPDAWLARGGDRATIGERDGVLLVTAPPTTHRRFRDALRRLRAAQVRSVTMEAAIVDVPRASFDALNRRFDVTTARLGRALLAARDATVRWRTVTAAALDTPVSIGAEGAGVSVQLAVTPRFDRATGILTLDIAARTEDGADRRTLHTTTMIPFRDGGAVLEMAAAAPDEATRWLVVLPRRR